MKAAINRHLEINRVLAVLVFLAMVIHTYYKWEWGTLPELLWGCNVASFTIIVGLWFDLPMVIGTGFLWHISVGEPGYVLGVIQTGHTGEAITPAETEVPRRPVRCRG